MAQLPDDYVYWRDAVTQHPEIYGTLGSLKHELACNRDAWREAEVILEITKSGTGERSKVLLSPSRYVDFWRKQTRNRVA